MLDPSEGFLPPLEVPADSDNDRRGFLRKAGVVGVAAAAATVAAPLFDSQAALANATEWEPPSPQAAGLLPTIGQTVNCSCNAFGASLFVNLPSPLPTLNFIGSIVVKVLIGGADFVRLQVLDHTVEAGHPMFGKITIHLPDIDVTPSSVLKLGPGGLLQTLLLSFNITFERCGDCAGPFTFTTLNPAKLQADMVSFPPPAQGTDADGKPTGGQLYKLLEPISLGTISSSGKKTEYAQLRGMDINVGSLI